MSHDMVPKWRLCATNEPKVKLTGNSVIAAAITALFWLKVLAWENIEYIHVTWLLEEIRGGQSPSKVKELWNCKILCEA